MSNYIPIEKDMHCSHFCCSFNLSKCSCLGFNIDQSFFFGNDIRFMSTVIYHFGNSCAILVYIPNLQKAYLFLFFCTIYRFYVVDCWDTLGILLRSNFGVSMKWSHNYKESVAC